MSFSSLQRFSVIGGVLVLLWWIVSTSSNLAVEINPTSESESLKLPQEVAAITERVDSFFEKMWNEEGVTTVEAADELQLFRRLSLSLHGTIPSLEEIRRFEADTRPNRISHWCAEMMEDDRFAWYFAERFARILVGTENGEFVVFRRDRFREWLMTQFQENRPYDEMVQQLITEKGLWTGKPAANFVTGAVNEGVVDVNKLSGRTVRAFLGQRIDCAQCHDDRSGRPWSQADFQELASFYNRVVISPVGVEDTGTRKELNELGEGGMMMSGGMTGSTKDPKEEDGEDEDDLAADFVDPNLVPSVPFHPEWLGKEGTRRERLAVWVTHPENRRFHRAIVNRVWGLLYGRPYSAGNVYNDDSIFVRCSVDDLPDPVGSPNAPDADLLDFLGHDFVTHGCDLRRLILTIASSKPYALSSQSPELPNDSEKANQKFEKYEGAWAVYPLVRLRPEQIVGSVFQARYIQTIDQNSHLLTRLIRFFNENDFLREYGDFGSDELEERSGTIPQTLLRMNGELVNETLRATLLDAAGRISGLSSSDENCLENCFLTVLTRRPNEKEKEYFLPQLKGKTGNERSLIVEDIFWSMLNAPEFSWNH